LRYECLCTMEQIKVLYVEDELNLATIVHDTLKSTGYDVRLVTDGAHVEQEAATFKPDICVLDIMLPNVDGFQLGKALSRRYPTLPILFLTARNSSEDVVKGFHSGGNDYIKKPFSMEELIIRIDNLLTLKSGNRKRLTQEVIAIGRYSFNVADHSLRKGEEIRNLSYREVEILQYCCDHMNDIIRRKEILTSIWGDDSYYNSRNLDVYMKRMRSYLAGDPAISIKTLRGVGYKFNVS